MRLIQEEFAFDGYLDNGLEALIMGMKATGATLEAQDKGERLREADPVQRASV